MKVVEEPYDSRSDTMEHIKLVRQYVNFLANHLVVRGIEHDNSKLLPPEKAILDEVVPKLKELTYGSEEYNETAKELSEYKEHHNKHNRHHASYFENGIKGMNLVDVAEMFADWAVATITHNADSNIYRSIGIMQDKLGFGDDLKCIFENTARDFNMGKVENETT